MRALWHEPGVRLAGRWLVAGLLLALVMTSVDMGLLSRQLAGLSVPVLALALSLTVLQVLLSAWRWRYTAGRLGLTLGYRTAVAEYYLATFLNQVLPGGVLGDVNRAWRHAGGANARVDAVHAVIIERLSGQAVLAVIVLAGTVWLAFSGVLTTNGSGFFGGNEANRGHGSAGWFVALLIGLPALLWGVGRFSHRFANYVRQLRRDLYRSLLAWPAFPVQLASSLGVIASYLLVFLILAWGAQTLNGPESVAVTAVLCAVLLVSMVVPLTVAGWGVREGVAALLWPLAGLPAEQGVALSVGYGLVVFVSSWPGALILFSERFRPG